MDRNIHAVQIVIVEMVALRKESVDRNSIVSASIRVSITSLSARRAWIEILIPFYGAGREVVALRKESVDRNNTKSANFKACISRSPQGERG